MARLVFARYIPKQTSIVKVEKNDILENKFKGCSFEKFQDDRWYLVTTPPSLQMVFRDQFSETDFSYSDMINEVYRYYKKETVTEEEVYDFIRKIITEEIIVSILFDRSYIISWR